jgi:hypothetical protein
VAEGITSRPVAMHDQECASRVLGLGRRTADLSAPEEHRVAMVLSFGYPESGRRPPVWAKESLHRGIPRTSLDELVRHERW